MNIVKSTSGCLNLSWTQQRRQFQKTQNVPSLESWRDRFDSRILEETLCFKRLGGEMQPVLVFSHRTVAQQWLIP